MDKTALESLLRSYNWWMGLSTIAVAVGILGEYVAHFVFEEEARRDRREMAVSILFGVLVLGGVVGEYIFGKELTQVSEQLQQIADTEVAQANRDAAAARKEADSFQSQIADDAARTKEAEAKIASAESASEEATAIAEREKLERLKLAALVSPRTLSIDQQQNIGATCASLYLYGPAKRIYIHSYGMDGEAAALLLEIGAGLNHSRLYTSIDIGSEFMSGGFDFGVLIAAPPEDEQFATCLANALINIGKLKDVVVNGPRHMGSTMRGSAAATGNVIITGSAGVTPAAPLAPGSRIDILVGVKLAEMIESPQ